VFKKSGISRHQQNCKIINASKKKAFLEQLEGAERNLQTLMNGHGLYLEFRVHSTPVPEKRPAKRQRRKPVSANSRFPKKVSTLYLRI